VFHFTPEFYIELEDTRKEEVLADIGLKSFDELNASSYTEVIPGLHIKTVVQNWCTYGPGSIYLE
jgi:hypothetical protein